jgi:polysaccharide export outer membrane protein
MTTSSLRHPLILIAVLLAGAVFGPLPRARADKPRYVYTITVADKVRVEVFQEDLTALEHVDALGNLNLPLLGTVHVAGLTVDQAQAAIAKDYVDRKFLRHPQVTISIDEYAPREVTIQGQVRNPNRYLLPMESTMTVVELVTKAGGFTDIAKGSQVKITRFAPDGTKTVIIVDVDAIIRGKSSAKAADNSLLLQPGDLVYVPESII